MTSAFLEEVNTKPGAEGGRGREEGGGGGGGEDGVGEGDGKGGGEGDGEEGGEGEGGDGEDEGEVPWVEVELAGVGGDEGGAGVGWAVSAVQVSIPPCSFEG